MLEPEAHFQRMHRSARILKIDLPYGVDELVDRCCALLRKNEVQEDAYLRPLLLLAGETLQVRTHDITTRFSVAVTPMGLNYINPDGVRCIVSSWRRNPDSALPNRAKAIGGYVGPAMGKTEALQAGADEAIMLNMDGHVAEATTSNIFVRFGDSWVTPPLCDDILEGITRKQVMTLFAEKLRCDVLERSIDRSELYVADEMFLCGTAAMIVPVVEVDGRRTGTGQAGETTLLLQRTLVQIARRQLALHPEWTHVVYTAVGSPS